MIKIYTYIAFCFSIALLGCQHAQPEPVLNMNSESELMESLETMMLEMDQEDRDVFFEAFSHVLFYDFTFEPHTTEELQNRDEHLFDVLHGKNAKEVIEISEKLGPRPVDNHRTIELQIPLFSKQPHL
jgi:hypothetical protein